MPHMTTIQYPQQVDRREVFKDLIQLVHKGKEQMHEVYKLLFPIRHWIIQTDTVQGYIYIAD